jgi:hypothetical protein
VNPPSEREEARPQGDRPAVKDWCCPLCGGRRLLFSGDKGSPWRCLECGLGFRVPRRPEAEGEAEDEPPHYDAGPERCEAAPHAGAAGWDRTAAPDHDSADRGLSATAFGWPVRLAGLLASLFAVVLGAHGLYVYLDALDGLPRDGGSAADLFLAVDVPSHMDTVVAWCSHQSSGSWFVPVCLIFAGSLLLWLLQVLWHPGRVRLP